MLLAIESVNSGLLFDLEKLDKEINELTAISEKEDFWNDQKSALKVISKLNFKRDIASKYRDLVANLNDLSELLDIADDSILESINDSFEQLKKDTKEFETTRLFSGEFDSLNAIIEIHPGAGGTEAQDWADMLYRMYVRFAGNHRFKMQVISFCARVQAHLPRKKARGMRSSGPWYYIYCFFAISCRAARQPHRRSIRSHRLAERRDTSVFRYRTSGSTARRSSGSAGPSQNRS